MLPPALPLNAAAWFISILKKTSVHILVPSGGSEEWDSTYKIRTVVERNINHMKENLCLAGRRTQNQKTLHADLVLAGITQLITVLLADRIHHHEYIRSLKPLVS